MSQKRAEGSRRALTREKNRILLSSSHRVSDDVSGFVSVTIVLPSPRIDPAFHVPINDRKVASQRSPSRFPTQHLPISVSFVDRNVNGT